MINKRLVVFFLGLTLSSSIFLISGCTKNNPEESASGRERQQTPKSKNWC